MKNILNIKEFAQVAGVSTATVSRVFSGDAKVRPETREHVRALAAIHGFRINQVAKSLLAGKTRSVGILLHRLSTSYFADIALGIQEVLYPAGYLPLISSLPRNSEMDALRQLIDRRVDGIIAAISEMELTPAELTEIHRFQLPIVTIDGMFHRPEWDNVRSDEEAAGRMAAEHLIACGYRKFGVSSRRAELWDSPRLAAFAAVTAQAGYPTARLDNSAEALARFGRGGALYCYNDFDALAIYREAEAVGWAIPADVAVVGTADLNFTEAMTPRLTTIRQDGVEIGRTAARLMLSRFNSSDPGGRHIILPVTWINGMSTNHKGE